MYKKKKWGVRMVIVDILQGTKGDNCGRSQMLQ